jgi:hypothetical protein
MTSCSKLAIAVIIAVNTRCAATKSSSLKSAMAVLK